MAQLVLLKTVKNAKLFQDPQSKVKAILLQNVRASFPFVGTPGKDEDESGNTKESWRIMGMMPKDTHGEAKKLIEELFLELQASNDVKVPRTEWALQDGDGEKYTSDEKYKSMLGNWLINAKDARIHPRVYNERGEPMSLTEEGLAKIDDKFYGGCWVNLTIRPWYFNGTTKGSPKKFPKRLLCGLVSVQFHHDDTPFGQSRIDDSGLYEAVEGSGTGMEEAADVDDL